MKRVSITPGAPHPDAIAQAVDVLKAGGVVVYPTDTCYGLGVDARNASAVRRLAAMKQRNQAAKPFSIIVSSIDQLKTIANVGETIEPLLYKYLPGPFTFLLPNIDFRIVRGSSIGVRIPRNATTRMLATKFGAPFTTTSANESGQASPYSFTQLERYLLQPLKARKQAWPDLMLDAGTLPNKEPSTVVDLTQEPPMILRQGSGKFRGKIQMVR